MLKAFRLAFILAALLAPSSRGQGLDGHDFFLSSPYALKAVVPLLFLSNAMDDPGLLPFEAVMLGALTFPNAMTLQKVYTRDSAGAETWRRRVFWCDVGMAAASAGLASYLIASSRFGDRAKARRNDYALAGALLLGTYTLPSLGFAWLDRLPFNMERRDPALPRVSLGATLPAVAEPGAPRREGSLLATSDWFLSTPYALKAVLPLFLLPEALADPDAAPIVALLIAGVSVPNFIVVRNLYTGDGPGTRRWRKAASWTELGLGLALAGIGAYYIASGSFSKSFDRDWDVLGGALIITVYAVPLVALSFLDRIPFKLESAPARFSLGLRMAPTGPGSPMPGLDLRLQIPI
jgi:hypothetical protein